MEIISRFMAPRCWEQMVAALGLQNSATTDIAYRDVTAAYAEPQRFYHTAVHIEDCLAKLNASKSLAEYLAEVKFALWFHDAVYKPYAAGNEASSAAWARTILLDAGASGGQIERIDDLIMATQHAVAASTQDARLLVDIDLSILGANVTDYEVFEKNVRKEYRWVPYFLYRKKRAEILQSFLDRTTIYNNDFFIDRYESRARMNLQTAVKKLSSH